jgi:hypothetical protein
LQQSFSGFIQAEIGDLIDLVIHVERRNGKRYISHVVQVHEFNPDSEQYQTESLYSCAAHATKIATVAGQRCSGSMERKLGLSHDFRH